jgi:hypothetical protein
MGDISLDTTQTQEPINLDVGSPIPTLPLPVSSARASKAAFGLSNITDKDYKGTHEEISSGREQDFRQGASSAADANKLKQFMQGQLTIDKLTGHKTDPRSVIESYYSGQYLKPMYDISDQFTGGSFMRDAQAEIPEHVQEASNRGSMMIAKREALLNRAENLEAAYEQQSTFNRYTQSAFNLIPLTAQAITRAQIPDQREYKLLYGEDLVEQSKAAYRQPMGEFNDTLDRIEQTIGKTNPSLAASFLRQLAGMSTDERIMQNEFGIIDLATIAGPISGALSNRIKLYNHVQGATQDAVRSSEHVGGIQEPALSPEIADWENEGGAPGREPIPVTAAAGRGDVGEAAIQKASSNLVEDATGKSNAQKRSLEALTSEHRVDLATLKEEKERGVIGQDLYNRLEEAYTRHDIDVPAALETAMRVNRVPIFEAAPDVVRAVEERIKEGDHSIMDVKTRLDPITNTYEHEITLGNAEGKLFKDRASAEANAEFRGLTLASQGPRWNRRAELHRMIAAARDRLNVEPTAEETELGKEPDIQKNIDAWTAELNFKQEGYTVEQQGNGYYISYTRPTNEFERAVDEKGRDLGFYRPITGPTKADVPPDPSMWTRATRWFTPERWSEVPQAKLAREEIPYIHDQESVIRDIRVLFGWVRTGDETEAYEQSTAKGIAAHAANVILPTVKKVSVPSKFKKDFNRILKLGQHLPDPDNGNIPGRTFTSIEELQGHYLTHIGRLPSEPEIEAYIAYKLNGDLDLALRRIQLYIPKATRSAEQHQFSTIGPNGTKVKSGFFEGIRRDGIPIGDDNIAVIGTHAGMEKVYKGNDIKFLKIRRELEPEVREGRAAVIEILSPDTKPLKSYEGIKDNRIRYVIVRSYEVKPLSLQGQLPRRGGGHLMPDYEWASKQARVERDNIGASPRDIYTGDTTAWVFNSRKTAQQIIDKKNAVREILDSDPKKFGKYTKDTITRAKEEFRGQGLPLDWDEFFREFQETRDPNGVKVPPRFNTHEPFTLVNMRKSETIGELNNDLQDRYPKTFVDGTKQGSIARTINVEFSGERDAHELMTIADKGGRNNPVYSYERAQLVDPIEAQQRGLARIINSTWMNDVKVFSMNHWLKNAERWLAADKNEIWHAPYYYFNNVNLFGLGTFKKGTPFAVRNLLLANHQKIQAFLGTPSWIDNTLHIMSQHLADDIHGVLGPKLVPRAMLSQIKDPIPFMRSMTYHVDMGLFSVKQAFTQASTISNVIALEPVHAPAASIATLAHGWTHINSHPDIIKALDEKVSMMSLPGTSSFKPGQFTEAYQLAKSTGFITVGNEHAMAGNYPVSANVVKTGAGYVLDWGLTPFKLGAETVRSTAFYTSYLKFRKENPNVRLTRTYKVDIFSYARLLDHNMSRESNSLLHTGIMSAPGQFFAYDLRLGEIFTGKRISPVQKLRLFTTSSILYGLKGAVGLTGLPLAMYMEKRAIDSGSANAENNRLNTAALQGLTSLIGAMVTSNRGWDPKYGNWYDFSKFGNRGIGYLEEGLQSDVTMWKIIKGATGSMFDSIFRNTSAIRMALMPHMLGGVDGYQFSYEQALDSLKTVASYREAWRVKAAIHTGKWMSENGTAIDNNVSVGDALFMGLTGLQHTQYGQTYVMEQLLKDQEDYEKSLFKMAKADFNKYLQAVQDKDPEQAKKYKENAFAIMDIPGGFPPHRKAELMSALSKGNESMMQNVAQEYFTRSQTEDKMEEWKDFLRTTTNKGQQ